MVFPSAIRCESKELRLIGHVSVSFLVGGELVHFVHSQESVGTRENKPKNARTVLCFLSNRKCLLKTSVFENGRLGDIEAIRGALESRGIYHSGLANYMIFKRHFNRVTTATPW
jgi:hypothetical protein